MTTPRAGRHHFGFGLTIMSAGAMLVATVLVNWLGGGAARAQVAPSGVPGVEVPPPGSRTCAKECHKEILNHKVMHGPVESNCGACHLLVGDPQDHKFVFVVPKDQLCAKCHALPHENSMHRPVTEGKCLSCHDAHGSDHVRVLRADPKKDLCLSCHKQEFSKSKFVHGPVAVGACIVCHKAHSSTEPTLLVQNAKALCLGCHSEVQTQAKDGLHIHAALEQGCTGCHDPHASDHKFQLKQEAPELCMSCHKEKFEQMTAGATVVHGAVTAEGGCTTCHEPHASKHAALQRGGEVETCLSCHNAPLKATDGKPLDNMATLLQKNTDWHGPIKEGSCTACHDPHASKNFRLLAQAYPPEFYAKFSMDEYKLCFKCHVPDLVLKPKGMGLTQFRNGDTNLHYLHVNQEKGRTCRACHEVHASKNPSHIRDSVPFGNSGWMLDINFKKTQSGGSCGPGCHTEKAYDRLNPVQSLKPALGLGASGPAGTGAAPMGGSR